VDGLEDAGLVGAEFLEFGFEESRFLVGDGFFVEDEHVTDVVVVNLCAEDENMSWSAHDRK